MPHQFVEAMRQFSMVTLLAYTSNEPLRSTPLMTAPSCVTLILPASAVSFVPAGTPVLLAFGKPQEAGVEQPRGGTGPWVAVGCGVGVLALVGAGIMPRAKIWSCP